MKSAILKFVSIVLIIQAVFTFASGMFLAVGSKSLTGTEYETLIGATVLLGIYAIVGAVIRFIAGVIGLRTLKRYSFSKAAVGLGVVICVLDLLSLINSIRAGGQGAAGSVIVVILSAAYLYAAVGMGAVGLESAKDRER